MSNQTTLSRNDLQIFDHQGHMFMFYRGRYNHKYVVFHTIFRRYNCTKNNKNEQIEIPPEPTNCCMSGCANCVWIEYAETISKMFKDGGSKARDLIMEKVTDPNMRAYLSMELRNLERNKISSINADNKNSTATNQEKPKE